MSDTKTSESTSYSGSSSPWLRGYARRGINSVFGAYDNAAPTLDRAVQGTSSIAGQLENKFGGSSATAGLAQDHWSNILKGGFLSGNPQLQSIIDSSAGDIRNAVGANYAGAGRYGSGMHDGEVARQVGDMSSQLRYGDYNNQLGRMDQAASAAANANAGDAQIALGALGQQGNLPFAGMTNLSSSLAALFNGGSSQSTTYGPNPWIGALGGAAGAAATYFSDERLKKGVELVRVRPDGLAVKSWIYRNDPEQKRYEGFVAQDVAKVYPGAVIEDFNRTGFMGVDYGKIPHESKLAA
jgi:hypothetical protein